MKLYEEKEKLICIVQDMINVDNALIAKIQDTIREREQLLLKLAGYDTEEKKHGDLATEHGISIKREIDIPATFANMGWGTRSTNLPVYKEVDAE